MAALRKARDLQLLDAIDALPREAFAGPVWRVVREGRDPGLSGRSSGRWSAGEFDVLYTSLMRDGAIAEIYALLLTQPVFPSRLRFLVNRLAVRTSSTLKFADLAALERLGVDSARYGTRDCARTQEIADAAWFLGFDGLIAPSARWTCQNLVLFTDRIADALTVERTEPDPIDWDAWRKSR